MYLPRELLAYCAHIVTQAWQSLAHQCSQLEVWQQIRKIVDHGTKGGKGRESKGLIEDPGSKVRCLHGRTSVLTQIQMNKRPEF